MRITHFWYDQEMVCAVHLDDGCIVAGTEEAAVTINTEGVITARWKEEPTDDHWGDWGDEPNRKPLPISEEMDALIFKASRCDGETAANAARELKAMIDGLVS